MDLEVLLVVEPQLVVNVMPGTDAQCAQWLSGPGHRCQQNWAGVLTAHLSMTHRSHNANTCYGHARISSTSPPNRSREIQHKERHATLCTAPKHQQSYRSSTQPVNRADAIHAGLEFESWQKFCCAPRVHKHCLFGSVTEECTIATTSQWAKAM